MIYKPFPTVPKELIEELSLRFPDRCPEKGSSLEDYYRKQGQMEIIDFLNNQFKQQNLNILEN